MVPVGIDSLEESIDDGQVKVEPSGRWGSGAKRPEKGLRETFERRGAEFGELRVQRRAEPMQETHDAHRGRGRPLYSLARVSLMASCRASKARRAHLIRTGNLLTP